MATFSGNETVNNVQLISYTNGLALNQGLVNYTIGLGYITLSPFYTCPAGKYAKIILKNVSGIAGDLYIGNASFSNGLYGRYGTRLTFGHSTIADQTFTTVAMGNATLTSSNGGGMTSFPEFYIHAGEYFFRDNGASVGGATFVFMVIEYAIP